MRHDGDTTIDRRRLLVLLCGAAMTGVAHAAPALADGGVWRPAPGVLAAAAATPARYDPPGAACRGGLTPAAVALRTAITRATGITDIGGYACRANTASPSRLSVHAVGRALDVMVRGDRGDRLADALVRDAASLGVQLVIWRRRIWRSGSGGLRAYGGPNPHTDHIHVEVFASAPEGTTADALSLGRVAVAPRLTR